MLLAPTKLRVLLAQLKSIPELHSGVAVLLKPDAETPSGCLLAAHQTSTRIASSQPLARIVATGSSDTLCIAYGSACCLARTCAVHKLDQLAQLRSSSGTM